MSDTAGTQTVLLSGPGTTNEVYASPASVNFGDVAVGGGSYPIKIFLLKKGSTEISVTSVSGDLTIPDNYCVNGVKPNNRCYVDVVFDPTQLSALSGTLTFVDNTSGSPQTVSLSGTGS